MKYCVSMIYYLCPFKISVISEKDGFLKFNLGQGPLWEKDLLMEKKTTLFGIIFFKLNYLQNHVLGDETDTFCFANIWISFFFLLCTVDLNLTRGWPFVFS